MRSRSSGDDSRGLGIYERCADGLWRDLEGKAYRLRRRFVVAVLLGLVLGLWMDGFERGRACRLLG